MTILRTQQLFTKHQELVLIEEQFSSNLLHSLGLRRQQCSIIDLSQKNASTYKAKVRNLLFSSHFVHRSITHCHQPYVFGHLSLFSKTFSSIWPKLTLNFHQAQIHALVPILASTLFLSSGSVLCTRRDLCMVFLAW